MRGISIGKLRTYQLYESIKIRTHLAKLNTENLRYAASLLEASGSQDAEFATDLSQAILIAHMEMIVAVLNFSKFPIRRAFSKKTWTLRST